MDDHYLISIAGTQYFQSGTISFPHCLQKNTKSGVNYYHQVLAASFVCPGIRQVLPLSPEPIRNQDGSTKQDCERNAGKRLTGKIRKTHPKMKIIITGDGLYSNQPFIETLKTQGISYILVAKPNDHKVLYEWFSEIRDMGETSQLSYTDAKGRHHTYEWVNEIPVNGRENAVHVNFFAYRISHKGKVTYKNNWITDIPITENNISVYA